MWCGESPATPQQDALMDLFQRVQDKDALLQLVVGFLLDEFRKNIKQPFMADTMREIGISDGQLESDLIKTLPSALFAITETRPAEKGTPDV